MKPTVSRYIFGFTFILLLLGYYVLYKELQCWRKNVDSTHDRKITSHSRKASIGGKIFCMLFSWNVFHPEDNPLFHENSWVAECERAVVITANESFAKAYPANTIFVDIPVSSNLTTALWLKTIASINYFYKHGLNDFEWFLTANEDTFVNMENLRCYLSRFNSSETHYFGYSWPGLLRTGHVGGYALSGSAVSWLSEVGLANTTLCSENNAGSERIRSCLQKINVYSGIDPDFHKAFLPQNYSDEKPRLILGWNAIFKGDMVELAAKQAKNCPFNCILSFDQILVHQADAVIFHFHFRNAKELEKSPTVRYPWQRYIFLEVESNANSYFIPSSATKLFNWSMTYGSESDIGFHFYGQFLPHTQSTSSRYFVERTALNKSKMVAWLVWHCDTHSKREEYVNALRQYVSIDQFGCGGKVDFNYSCPRDPVSISSWCGDIPFTTNYRFYLAFENSICANYVTEKFFRALDRLMVPIVLRNADYVDIAPSGSYIAVDQFHSPKDLGDYLHFLANHPNEYLKYFDYTKSNKVVLEENQMLEEGVCRLCRMLHENRTTTIGADMRARWVKEGDCVESFAKNLLQY